MTDQATDSEIFTLTADALLAVWRSGFASGVADLATCQGASDAAAQHLALQRLKAVGHKLHHDPLTRTELLGELRAALAGHPSPPRWVQ